MSTHKFNCPSCDQKIEVETPTEKSTWERSVIVLMVIIIGLLLFQIFKQPEYEYRIAYAEIQNNGAIIADTWTEGLDIKFIPEYDLRTNSCTNCFYIYYPRLLDAFGKKGFALESRRDEKFTSELLFKRRRW